MYTKQTLPGVCFHEAGSTVSLHGALFVTACHLTGMHICLLTCSLPALCCCVDVYEEIDVAGSTRCYLFFASGGGMLKREEKQHSLLEFRGCAIVFCAHAWMTCASVVLHVVALCAVPWLHITIYAIFLNASGTEVP